MSRCDYCPVADATSSRERKRSRKAHEPVDGWFSPPLILPEYLPALGQLFMSLRDFDSVRDLTEHKEGGTVLHGFRTPSDLTAHGKAVFDHTGIRPDLLEAGLFRFRVSAKARLWCLGDRENGEFEILFWDPHHYLGTGHRYNDFPPGPEWDRGPFNDEI